MACHCRTDSSVASLRQMSKSRTTSTNKKTERSKEPRGKPADLDAFDASQIDVVLPQLLSRHAPITDVHRAAFAGLISDAQADALGARSQAVDIRAQAMRWAPILDAGVRAHPQVLEGYTSERFVHLLERTMALHQAIRADEQKRNKVGAVKTAADEARTIALSNRDALYRSLRAYAGQRQAERSALSAAYGTSKSNEETLTSLTALAKLGAEWIDRADPVGKILAKTAHLTPELLAAALDAAKKLKEAMSGATMEGGARAQDSATVNRLEGRVCYELLEARRIFNNANARTGAVAKLVPNPSVRHLFVRKAGAAGSSEEPADDPTEEPTPEETNATKPPKG